MNIILGDDNVGRLHICNLHLQFQENETALNPNELTLLMIIGQVTLNRTPATLGF